MFKENFLYGKNETNYFRYREREAKDMTYILGARCKDGVVLIGDRKVTLEGGTDFSYEDKLFKDIHPIVVGSSGVAGLFDMFRNRVNAYVAERRGQIGIQSFIEAIADMTKEVNDRWSPRLAGNKFDVLLGIQLTPISALLYIYPYGFPESVRRYQAIGHGAPYGSLFLKRLWNSDMTMEQTGELGYFIIKCIDKLELDNSVGGDPQIWFIPDPFTGQVSDEERPKYDVRQADQQLYEKFKAIAESRLDKLKDSLQQIFIASSV